MDKTVKKELSEVNNDLLKEQKFWARRLYKKVFDDYKTHEDEKGKLSCAFGFGLSEHYINSDKKIMVIGQEANGHTCNYEKWGLEKWQHWAIDYLDFQLYDEDKNNRNFTKNPSPFWQFLNKLKEKDYGVCWNNIDKVRRYIQNNGVEATEDFLLECTDGDKNKDRSVLHEKIFDGDSKSLLQKEIAIAQPDIVVFAIGPKNPYYHSLSLAFFNGENVDDYLNERGVKYPQMKDCKYCIDISESLKLKMPAFYTYHPNYLSRKKIMDDVIKLITSK